MTGVHQRRGAGVGGLRPDERRSERRGHLLQLIGDPENLVRRTQPAEEGHPGGVDVGEVRGRAFSVQQGNGGVQVVTGLDQPAAVESAMPSARRTG